jgi:hypothetical protein
MPEPAAAPAAGARVPIVTRDGQVGTVPEADLADALKAGASIASTAQVEKTQLVQETEERFGALATPAAIAAAGARGLTLGLSDVAITKGAGALGYSQEGASRGLRGLEESSPIASPLAELGGNIAPLLLSGGTAAAVEGGARAAETGLARGAVRILGAPVEAASALGRGAEALAQKAIGAAGESSVLGRVGREVAGKAISGAAEGMAYGAGNAASQAALDNHDLTAEELVASMGGAALFGSVLGGVSAAPFAIGGEAVSALGKGARSLSEGAGALAAGARDTGERLYAGAKEAGESLVAKGREVLDKALPGSGDDFLARADKGATELANKHFDLAGASDDNAARATYGRKKFVETADKQFPAGPEGEPGGWRGVGRVLKDTGVIDVKEGLLTSARNPEELLPRISERLEQRGASIGDLAKQSTGTVKVGDIASAIEDVIAKHEGKAGFGGITSSLRTYQEDLYSKLGARKLDAEGLPGNLLIGKKVPVADLAFQRKALDDLAFKEAKSLDPGQRVEFLRDIRRGLKDLERDAIVSGGVDAKVYDKLNREYQGLRIAQDATSDSISRGAANRSVGATDYLSFIGGSAAGGPLAGGALALANKLARERGSAAASVFLHDVAESGSLLSAAKKAGVDVTGGAKKLYEATEGIRSELGPHAEALKEQATQALANLQNAEVMNQVARQTMAIKRDIGDVAKRIGTTVVGAAKGASEVRRISAMRGYETFSDFQRRKSEVEAIATSPGALEQGLGNRMTALGSAAPAIVGAMGQKASAMAQYLFETLPATSAPDPYSMTPLAAKQRQQQMTVGEMRWMRALQVIDNPKVALDAVEDGSLSIDQAKALRMAYPEIYTSMRTALIASIASRDPKSGPLPRAVESRLSILFDAPLRRTQTPEFKKAMQDLNPPPPDQEQQGGGGAAPPPHRPTKPLKLPSLDTEMQRIASGGSTVA